MDRAAAAQKCFLPAERRYSARSFRERGNRGAAAYDHAQLQRAAYSIRREFSFAVQRQMEPGFRELSAAGGRKPRSAGAQAQRPAARGCFSQPADERRTDFARIHEFEYDAAAGMDDDGKFRRAGAAVLEN